MTTQAMQLQWVATVHAREATIGDFAAGDGVRFTLERYPTCTRRGTWKLFIEIANGPMHHEWGCFDEQDQPVRWYHELVSALSEANAIATVLLIGRGLAPEQTRIRNAAEAKIAAIKEIRRQSNAGLREAKDAYERAEAAGAIDIVAHALYELNGATS